MIAQSTWTSFDNFGGKVTSKGNRKKNIADKYYSNIKCRVVRVHWCILTVQELSDILTCQVTLLTSTMCNQLTLGYLPFYGLMVNSVVIIRCLLLFLL